ALPHQELPLVIFADASGLAQSVVHILLGFFKSSLAASNFRAVSACSCAFRDKRPTGPQRNERKPVDGKKEGYRCDQQRAAPKESWTVPRQSCWEGSPLYLRSA